MITTTRSTNEDSFIEIVSKILKKHGGRTYNGLGLSVLEHMLQTAEEAEADGAKDHEIISGLLHDIGHFIVEFPSNMDNTEDTKHDEAGALILEPFFGPEIVEPIRLHVLGKRYLCTVEPAYFDCLSVPVKHTFRLQGGKMSPKEVADFEAFPYSSEAVNVRRWCDRGMTPGKKTKTFEDYHSLIEEQISKR